MRPFVTAFIALGANLGDPGVALRQAMDDLDLVENVKVVKRSSLYRTAPIDSSGPDYVNAVVEVSTQLTAPALLAVLQLIENQAGRARPFPNAPRTLDLDLLLFGDAFIHSPALEVPHPRMWQRAFVLVPLAEVACGTVSAAQLLLVQGQTISTY
jgi:2-amino-4-hydroxy-6-hydroxymethyldihydropteridine diphosphokinase